MSDHMLNDGMFNDLGPALAAALKRADLIAAVFEEVERARQLFPGSAKVTMALMEEAGEALKEAMNIDQGKGSPDQLRRELVQTMAMCIRLLEEGDPTLNVEPLL